MPLSIIIFTDLDGTLLDHHDYRFDAALPALAEVRRLEIPLILTTSKTLAEVEPLNQALENPQPVIIENGGAMAFPLAHDYPFELTAHERNNDHAIIRFSPPYAQIRSFIEEQRDSYGYGLRGFGDMSTAEIAQETGLDGEEAARAKQRTCSEPFQWSDSEERLRQLGTAAQASGLRLTRGGRFWHLMGDTNKAEALRAMRNLYNGSRESALLTIALGDSDNDLEMLQTADIAVVIKHHDGSHLDCHGIKRTIKTEQPGPTGWNSAILQLISELDTSPTSI